MIITEVEAIWLRVPARSERCEWGEDALIVRIHTDSGLIGIGETDSSPAVIKALIDTPASHSSCQGLREVLLGENPLHIGRLWNKMFQCSEYMGRRGAGIHAISALDIALWDIAGQHYGVPLHTLLGGQYRDRIEAYGTFIPGATRAENQTLLDRVLCTGVRSVKVGGAGFGLDAAQDVRTLSDIRRCIGEDIGLNIDLVGRWRNAAHAQAQVRALRPFNLGWIEEPLCADDHRGLATLAATCDIPIAGGEGLTTRHEFKAFLQATSPAIVQPDITRCGGLSEACHIDQLAREYGARLVPHGFSTGILLAATAHFLASREFGELIEYSFSPSPLFQHLVQNPVRLHQGQVLVPQGPGLGITLDESVIERYRVR